MRMLDGVQPRARYRQERDSGLRGSTSCAMELLESKRLNSAAGLTRIAARGLATARSMHDNRRHETIHLRQLRSSSVFRKHALRTMRAPSRLSGRIERTECP